MSGLVAQVESEPVRVGAVRLVDAEGVFLEPDGSLRQPAMLSQRVDEFHFQRCFGREFGPQAEEKRIEAALIFPLLDFEIGAA